MPLPPHLVRQVTDRTEQIAFVGDQAILAGDLLPAVDQALQKYEGKVSPDEMQQQRALFVQQMLPRKIEVKLVLLDFLRSIPADKQKEVLANIEKQVEKQYYDEQVPRNHEAAGSRFAGRPAGQTQQVRHQHRSAEGRVPRTDAGSLDDRAEGRTAARKSRTINC